AASPSAKRLDRLDQLRAAGNLLAELFIDRGGGLDECFLVRVVGFHRRRELGLQLAIEALAFGTGEVAGRAGDARDGVLDVLRLLLPELLADDEEGGRVDMPRQRQELLHLLELRRIDLRER